MAQTRGTFDALNDNVDKTLMGIMKAQLKELPKIYPSVYNVKTSDRKFERIVTYVPFGDTIAKAEGDAYSMDQIRQGYTKDFTHTENGLGFEVTQTALEDDAENILNRAGDWLAFSARYVEEGRAANPFNKLVTANPPHWSPLEHVALPAPSTRTSRAGTIHRWSESTGNFDGWAQMRHLIPNGLDIDVLGD